ncbi:MAG: hypothetical protein JOZ69_06875 [Myxococcales bacterium]|nr:hypothetical protein [Myxococcales bacterium]
MSVSYKCTNPECGVTLKTPNRVAVGKSVKCPKCNRMFVPEPGEKAPADGPLKLADEPKKPEPAPATGHKKHDDDDEDADSVKKGYGVIAETEAEKEAAEKNKPKFTEVQEKFKKSARGPAMGLLVMPSNLLTLAGLLTSVGGISTFVYGMWPLVFNDAPPGEEELDEAIVYMMMGICTLFWGAMVCFGASQMQELASYPWAMVGSVMGVAPFLVGIYGIVMLQNPKVKAGFEETEGSVDEDEDEDKKKDDGDDDDDEDDDDDDDDDDEKSKKKKGKKASAGKKAGKGSKRMRDGDDDE